MKASDEEFEFVRDSWDLLQEVMRMIGDVAGVDGECVQRRRLVAAVELPLRVAGGCVDIAIFGRALRMDLSLDWNC